MECFDSETVLDTLLRNEAVVPYSCRSGHCRSCILQASKGCVPKSAQKGLKDTLCEQNYFLACQCLTEENLEIISPNDAELFVQAVVREKNRLAEHIYQLVIEPAMPLYYHAGQFINLRQHQGLVRSYSLASLPQSDSYLELHIKRYNNGKMSQWLIDELDVGQSVAIQGPYGTCYYSSAKSKQNLLLIGTGTGLAPLVGIIKDALHSKHQGEIFLYHGSRDSSGLYYQEVLTQIEKQFPQFHYLSCLSGDSVPEEVSAGRAHDIALENHKNLKDWCVYLCGDPSMVATAKKRAYLAGAALNNIYADPFELTDLRKVLRKV